jgi:hypothetical protein
MLIHFLWYSILGLGKKKLHTNVIVMKELVYLFMNALIIINSNSLMILSSYKQTQHYYWL